MNLCGPCSKSAPISNAFRASSFCESFRQDLHVNLETSCKSCLQIAVTSLVRVVFSVQRRPNVMYRFLGRSVLIAALVTFTGVAAFAQRDKDRSMTCRDNDTMYNDRLVSNCEMR